MLFYDDVKTGVKPLNTKGHDDVANIVMGFDDDVASLAFFRLQNQRDDDVTMLSP